MTDPAERGGSAPEPGEPTVRLMMLGDPAGAPVCDGEVCYLPPVPATSEDPDRPQ